MITPKKVKVGDTIGIVAPCGMKYYEKLVGPVAVLKSMGFEVKFGKHIFNDTWGYAASAAERAEDFNEMARDDDVALVLFGGGDVGNEVLPYLDYDAIAKSAKAYCSYSDSTSILNAITAKTGLITFHGQTPRTFENMSEYNRERFFSVIVEHCGEHKKAAAWKVLRGGKAEGKLVGGYTQNVCLMLSSPYFNFENEGHILFLEDYYFFSEPVGVARYMEHIMQSKFFDTVSGVIFGGFGEGDEAVTEILARKADIAGLPFIKCDDFGHGKNNAIFPIGSHGVLDANNMRLNFVI